MASGIFAIFDDITPVIKLIFENVAKASGINRISFWNYYPDSIHCRDLYELDIDKHSNHLILYKKDLPIYFDSIEKEEIIVASDVMKQKETSEFVNTKKIEEVEISVIGIHFVIIHKYSIFIHNTI